MIQNGDSFVTLFCLSQRKNVNEKEWTLKVKGTIQTGNNIISKKKHILCDHLHLTLSYKESTGGSSQIHQHTQQIFLFP